jgi:hypothetical protein
VVKLNAVDRKDGQAVDSLYGPRPAEQWVGCVIIDRTGTIQYVSQEDDGTGSQTIEALHWLMQRAGAPFPQLGGATSSPPRGIVP